MYIYICIYTADCNQYDLDLIDRIASAELCNKHFMHVYSLVLICTCSTTKRSVVPSVLYKKVSRRNFLKALLLVKRVNAFVPGNY